MGQADGVDDAVREDGGAAALGQRRVAADERGADHRARGVVDEDPLDSWRERLEGVADGFLAFDAAAPAPLPSTKSTVSRA